MARKPSTKEPGTEVVDWEKEMRDQAAIAAGAQRSSGGGGKFFSMKAGVLSFDDNPLPGNQMAVVILADIIENSWYDGPYDPANPQSPKCFAFAHREADLEPHEAVDNDSYFERQSMECNGCIRNEWGSADVGRGKACKNVMRLSMIPAGQYKPTGKGRNVTYDLELIDDETHFAKAEPAFLKLPVMSVKNYSKYVKQLAADLGRPPHGVITNIYIEPDPKSQFAVKFELVDTLGGDLLPIIMPRHKVEAANIGFPYAPPLEDEQGASAKSNNKLRGGKGAAKRGR
jgi:hypothetical protein